MRIAGSWSLVNVTVTPSVALSNAIWVLLLPVMMSLPPRPSKRLNALPDHRRRHCPHWEAVRSVPL